MALSTRLPWDIAQPRWASELNPLLAQPLSSANILDGVKLVSGSNVINHLLGRMMQGWFLSDINAAVTVYRSAVMNDLTLTLTSSGAATVNIVVF